MSELRIGLEGVAVAESQISSVDGDKGGANLPRALAEEVVKDHNIEDIVYLLWFGKLPNSEESKAFKQKLVAQRELPGYIKDIIKTLPKDTDTMAVIRTAVSSMRVSGPSWPPTDEQAIEITLKFQPSSLFIIIIFNGQKRDTPRIPN